MLLFTRRIETVKLTKTYMSERFLPDKAIDALDEAGSRVISPQY
jgi:ATP-dependent Clp protease ATP-binding subunit ClpA